MDTRDTDDQAHLDRWQSRAPAPREFCPGHKKKHLGGTQVPFLWWPTINPIAHPNLLILRDCDGCHT